MSATIPHQDARAVAWAVFLGCTTALRLASEWGIPQLAASRRLRSACEAGEIVRDAPGIYRCHPKLAGD